MRSPTDDRPPGPGVDNGHPAVGIPRVEKLVGSWGEGDCVDLGVMGSVDEEGEGGHSVGQGHIQLGVEFIHTSSF